MTRFTRGAAAVLVAGAAFFGGCRKDTGQIHDLIAPPQYDRQLPPGALALRKITDPAQIPDFTAACRRRDLLRQAIDNSLHYLAKPSSRKYYPYGQISHEQTVASLQAFAALLDANLPPEAMNAEIRRRFDVYVSVGCDDRGTVLYTGYYTPIFEASLTRTDRFAWPLYRPPAGLVKDEEGNILGMRQADGTLTQPPTRKQYDNSGELAGNELVWLADPVEVYVAHVQGSAILRLPDGRLMTVGYAANNGHEYVSIGRELVADGKIAAEALSLQSILAYFKAHPEDRQVYFWRNPRYVFFAAGGDGPAGSLNEPVTPWRSIATDKAIYPRAALAYIESRLPQRLGTGVQELPYAGFACDQDTGGAIRAPGRCDIYMGIGDAAGELAGRTRQEGRLYYLFLKPGESAGPTFAPVGRP